RVPDRQGHRCRRDGEIGRRQVHERVRSGSEAEGGRRLLRTGLLQLTTASMPDRIYNVLFLCTGNSARSVLAESILRKDGAGRFRAFSAGSQPRGEINPWALKVLRSMEYPVQGFRSKSWLEFANPGAPQMDFVFTVCDSAAGEACPLWPG